jgi:hypothetical protein
MTEKKTAETTKDTAAATNDDLASLQFSVEGDPFWAADLYDSGRSVALYGKSKEQVEDRAKEILASRQTVAEAAKLGEAWDGVPKERHALHVTEE